MSKTLKTIYVILVMALAGSYTYSVINTIDIANRAYATCEKYDKKVKTSSYEEKISTVKIRCK